MNIFDYTGNATPTPPPSWASKIAKIIDRIFGIGGSQQLPDTTRSKIDALTEPYDSASRLTSMPTMWKVHQERRAMYMDIDRMDLEDEFVSTALDIIADFATGFTADEVPSLRVESKDTKTQAVLDALITRLDLANETWQIFRNMAKHGNELREVIIDREAMKIVKLKPTISYQIYPMETPKGDKVPGWKVVHDKDVINGKGGVELEEWQILPFMYGAKRGTLATPMLASARRNWNRLAKIDDGMAIARLTRGYDKTVHRVPINAQFTAEEITATLRRYKDIITKRKVMSAEGAVTQNTNPFDVETDFFIVDDGSGRGGVEMLNSTNIQLGNLNDVYYLRERLLSRLRVPIAYLQIMSTQKTHLKSGAIGDADIQFAKLLRSLHACYRRGLKRLFDMELLLNGIVPTSSYTIILPHVEAENLLESAKVDLTYAQAAAYFVEAFGALPPELIASKYMSLDEDQKKLMDAFLNTNGERIVKAKVKALEMAAQPKPTGGPGNNNKSKVARSSEQRGAASQDVRELPTIEGNPGDPIVPFEAAVDVFMKLHQEVHTSWIEAGLDLPPIEDGFEDVLRTNLTDIALAGRI